MPECIARFQESAINCSAHGFRRNAEHEGGFFDRIAQAGQSRVHRCMDLVIVIIVHLKGRGWCKHPFVDY
ncbi:MAG: hypothetical protein JWQ71_3676 [Pedosphaera sp.]|nr:hypothetical protein [Pedosphaera sp.]